MNAHKFVPFVGKGLSDDRTVSGLISTIDVDEEGDVVLPSGMDDGYFKDHPVLTLYHDDKLGVGKARNYKRMARGVWAAFGLGEHPDANQALHMVKAGILGGFSIEWNPRTLIAGPPTAHEREMYGDDCKRVFREWRLTGVSLVPKPMNGKCVVEGKSLDRLMELVRDSKVTAEMAQRLGVTIEPRKVRVFLDGDAVVKVKGAA